MGLLSWIKSFFTNNFNTIDHFTGLKEHLDILRLEYINRQNKLLTYTPNIVENSNCLYLTHPVYIDKLDLSNDYTVVNILTNVSQGVDLYYVLTKNKINTVITISKYSDLLYLIDYICGTYKERVFWKPSINTIYTNKENCIIRGYFHTSPIISNTYESTI